MNNEKVFKAENVDKLLNELFKDIMKEINGISTIKIEDLDVVKNQDARLVSVKSPGMEHFKPAGGGFLGKETNKKYVDLPNGEYLHLDEFINALKLYFEKKENKGRLFLVESDEWNGKKRKVSNLDELKNITRESSRLVLERIKSIETQDARVVSANIPNDSLTYDKRIGGAFLGSARGNLKRGLPAHILPTDDSPYIHKDDLIRGLEKIFKAYRNEIVAILPAVLPAIGVVSSGQVETTVEEEVLQDIEVPVYEDVVENVYSEGLVIGDVLELPEGTEFTHDSWGNPSIGKVGNKYAPAGKYSVNGFNVINTQTEQYYPCYEKGKSLEKFIEEKKAEGKITDENYKVVYHTNEGEQFTAVGGSNDIGWIPYDENNYPVSSRYPIGTETKTVQTGVTTEQETKIEYVTYEYETENMNEEISVLVMTDDDGNMLTLTSKDGGTFKLDEDIVLVDSNGKEYNCTVEKTDKKLRLKAIVPLVLPVVKKKTAEEEIEEKEGRRQK